MHSKHNGEFQGSKEDLSELKIVRIFLYQGNGLPLHDARYKCAYRFGLEGQIFLIPLLISLIYLFSNMIEQLSSNCFCTVRKKKIFIKADLTSYC